MIISGVTLQNNKKIDASIAVSGNCLNVLTTTKFGEYSIEVPGPIYNIPYNITLTYKVPQMSVSRNVQIGGIPLNSNAINPTVVYESPNSFNVNFQVHFLHGPGNEFTIEAREGYNTFVGGSLNTSNFNTSLHGGPYSFVASSTGYKSDLIEMIIDKDLTLHFVLIYDKIDENEIRVLLNWNGNVSLDIRSSFTLNSEIDCEVSYINKVCGGVKIVASEEFSEFGYQEISVKPIGAYQYLFYAVQNTLGKHSGHMKVFNKAENFPISKFSLGNTFMWNVPNNQAYPIWAGFCMNGINGVESIVGIQSYISKADQKNLRNICKNFYGEVTVYSPLDTFSIVAEKKEIPANITKLIF